MADAVLVQADGFEFYVEIDEDDDRAGPVNLDHTASFDGVADTVEAIAGQLTRAWQKVKPSEASVEFGLKVTGKSGKLTGLLVEGGGEASLTVKLTWKADEAGASPG